ncbi:MAG: TldD/PmbA family protein [Bacteroidales bacterium]|nr:TldD/PmbA family protein [Bacteroidales bacterium]
MKINRRNFLTTGGALMISSALFPKTILSKMKDQPHNKSEALTRFGITESDIKKTLATALEKGGTYADLFFEHTFSNQLALQDNTVNRADSNIDFGMGVRVLSGDQTGYAYVENITLEEMIKAAKAAAAIASSTQKQTAPVNLTEIQNVHNYYPIQSSWEKTEIQQKIPFIQKLNDRIFELDKRVSKVNVSLLDSTSHILFYNSEGNFFYDYRPMASFIASCIMEQNGQIENGYATRSFRTGFEFLNDSIIEELAQEAIQRTSILFDAIKPQGGEMPVVMGAGGSGILLHEAIGHAFEADFNRKNVSIFSDKLGKIVCNTDIDVIDDGTIPFNRGSINFDDEGVTGQKTYIVKNGKLNSYLHDRISAHHYGVAPTGNGRRESFRQIPIPRMRATYMENGHQTEEDIIASVKKGIYVDTFTNGQVQIGAGDFTFFVKSGYLIENGKRTQPIKDINIIGNGPKALADISMVAGNKKIDNGTWTCGKDGQRCPVTCGMPSVLVKKLTVGGES